MHKKGCEVYKSNTWLKSMYCALQTYDMFYFLHFMHFLPQSLMYLWVYVIDQPKVVYNSKVK